MVITLKHIFRQSAPRVQIGRSSGFSPYSVFWSLFRVTLTKSSNHFPKQHKLIGICKGDGLCSLWGRISCFKWPYVGRCLTTGTRFRSQSNPCEMCGAQRFLSELRLLPASLRRRMSTALVKGDEWAESGDLQRSNTVGENYFQNDFVSCLMILACLIIWAAPDIFLSCTFYITVTGWYSIELLNSSGLF
jgi:hypothetical protein